MVKFPFKITFPKIKISSRGCLGIDVGTSLIKVISFVKSGSRIKLENYGETSAQTLYENPLKTFEKNTLLLSTPEIARTIKAILIEANIQTKKAVFSIPDFSSFFTSFELPPMTKDELPKAIQFAAPQHIPLPLSEVTIDWQVIEGKVGGKKETKLKILLVAVPNEIIYQYREIAKLSNLELHGLEAEVFSLSRAVAKNNDSKNVISLVDIGAQSTTCSIIDKGILKLSHSFDIAGNELTQILAKALSLKDREAEELKKKYGLKFHGGVSKKESFASLEGENPEKISKALTLIVDSILVEIQRILQDFQQADNKTIQRVILAGGTVLMPGLQDYFASFLKKEVEVINPFANIFYPPVLEEPLRKMGPAYAIAIGAALRGLE